MNRFVFPVLLIISIVCTASAAMAAAQLRYYTGTMELLKLSGSTCSELAKPGKKYPIDMVVEQGDTAGKGGVTGYFGGQEIQTGQFSGVGEDKLTVVYPDPDFATGHTLSLRITGDSLEGDLREKPVTPKDYTCSFEQARMTLKLSSEAMPNGLLARFDKQYRSENEYYIGQDLYGKGKMDEALPHLESSLKLREVAAEKDPQRIRYPASRLAAVYAVMGRYDEAFALVERVLKTAEGAQQREEFDEFAMLLMTRQVSRLLDVWPLERTAGFVQRLRAQYPDAPYLLIAQAAVLTAGGKDQESCRLLEVGAGKKGSAVIVKRAAAGCFSRLGREVFDRDNPKESLGYLRKALNIYAARPDTWGGLLMAYSALGDFGDAHVLLNEFGPAIAKEYSQKEFDSVKAMFYQEEAGLVERKQDDPKAEQLFRKALALNPDEPDIATGLARVLHKTGRYPEAVRLLEEQRGRCGTDDCRKGVESALQREAMLEKLVKKIE